MGYDDFLSNFYQINICKYVENRFTATFDNKIRKKFYASKRAYVVHTTRSATSATIALSQRQFVSDIALAVFKCDAARPLDSVSYQFVGAVQPRIAKQINLELRLEASSSYIVLPYHTNRAVAASTVVVFYTQAPVLVRSIASKEAIVRPMLLKAVQGQRKGLRVYKLTRSVELQILDAGHSIFLVLNNQSSRNFELKLRYAQCGNLVGLREGCRDRSSDVVVPHSRQLTNIFFLQELNRDYLLSLEYWARKRLDSKENHAPYVCQTRLNLFAPLLDK